MAIKYLLIIVLLSVTVILHKKCLPNSVLKTVLIYSVGAFLVIWGLIYFWLGTLGLICKLQVASRCVYASLQPTSLENPHGQRSLVGYSPLGPQRVRHDWATKYNLSRPSKSIFSIQKWKCTVEVHVRLMGREHSMPWQDLDLTHCHFHLHFTGKNQSQSYTQYQWGGEICSTSRERNCKIIWQSLHIKGGMRYWVQEGRLLNFSLHSSHFS